jgi:ribosomal protein S10
MTTEISSLHLLFFIHFFKPFFTLFITGSKTWDRFQMRIHKRVIDFTAPTNKVKEVTNLTIPPGVDIEVTVM